jgi:hypothetical protein
VSTKQFNASWGLKIHNFNYSPTIYKVNSSEYLLSTLRSTTIWYFNDYTCHNFDWKLQIFGCPNDLTINL